MRAVEASVVAALVAVASLGSGGVAQGTEHMSDRDRDALRRRLHAVPPGSPEYASTRYRLGALEIGAGRDREAAVALEQALESGLDPADDAYPLLAWSYARLDDRRRTVRALRLWAAGSRDDDRAMQLLSRASPPLFSVRGEAIAGWDSNVRLDTQALGTGIGAAWTGAHLELGARPLRRREALVLRLGLGQRVHVTEREAAATYDVGTASVGAVGEIGVANDAVVLGFDVGYEETAGDLAQLHLARAGGLDVHAGIHPVGPLSFGLYASSELRDLDGEGLGDPELDGQDGLTVAVGPFGAYSGRAGRASLRLGWVEAWSRSADWGSRGAEVRLAGETRRGSLGIRLEGGVVARVFADRTEGRVVGAADAALYLGALSPYLRYGLEWNVADSEHRYTRHQATLGLALTWSSQ